MRINSVAPAVASLTYNKTNTAKKEETPNISRSSKQIDTIEFSKEAKARSAMAQAMGQSIQIDERRVESLRQQLSDSSYDIDSVDIALGMIREFRV